MSRQGRPAIAHTLRRLTAGLLALALLAPILAAAPAVRAANCTVDSTGDAVAADGVTTLREALQDAACPAIGFALPGDGPWVITPASLLPVIQRDLTLAGPGAASLTISGAGRLNVLWTKAGTVTIRGLTLTDGKSNSILSGGRRCACRAGR